jgi:hypothetical protein
MDRIVPSEGIDVGSIPAGRIGLSANTYLYGDRVEIRIWEKR